MKTTLLVSLLTASAAFGAVQIENVTFGFNDGYKLGTWAPLTMTVQAEEENPPVTRNTRMHADRTHLTVEVRSFSSDTPLQRYAAPVTGSQRKHFYVYCPKNATHLLIQLTQPGNTLSQHTAPHVRQEILLPTPIARKDYLVLVLAPSGDKLKGFIDKKQIGPPDDAQVHVTYLPNATALPRDWIGYSAVDVLVIREVSLTARRISKLQQTALLDWIQRGGTLIVAGGSNYTYLHRSFIEPFLPVESNGVEKIDTLPIGLHEPLGLRAFSSNRLLFERIQFTAKAGCETVIGTEEEIYVAKRAFGDGQILCLAFDYNALPFAEQQTGETFWHSLLQAAGKSPRHLADRYALALRHEEKIHRQFLSKMPTQVPIIKLLGIVLPVYLLSFSGFLFYFGKSQQKFRTYWIGGGLFILLSVSTIAIARRSLPNILTIDSLSVLSVYPERQRAHLLSYVSLNAAAHAETTLDAPRGTFLRPPHVEVLKAEHFQKMGTLIQDSQVQLQNLSVEPWLPTTYVKETFLDLQQLPRTLENVWYVNGKEMRYLGNVTSTADPESEMVSAAPRMRVAANKMPPGRELIGTREKFAQILNQEQLLRYLAEETTAQRPPYLIGWSTHGFTNIRVDGNVKTTNQTLVVFRPAAGH